jgi:hypothetical protein
MMGEWPSASTLPNLKTALTNMAARMIAEVRRISAALVHG